MWELKEIQRAEDIWRGVQELGFLPFFQNGIKGFSVEEWTPRQLWFSEREPGPWEWKGPVIRMGECFYGKFFAGKAGFVSREWFPAFANYRRDGYDFDALYEDGKAARKDKYIYDTVAENGSLLTGELKKKCNYGKGGNKGFETIITRLQMETYLVVEDFEYMRDKAGNTYGWGVARYSTPEKLAGEGFLSGEYKKEPEESRRAVHGHMKKLFPEASEKQLLKLFR